MYVALQFLCWGLVIGTPAILLAARFFWPLRMSWWLVLVATAILGTLLDASSDYLGPRADYERQDACFTASQQQLSASECVLSFYDVWVLPISVKWIPGVLCLVAWLPFYGFAVWLRTRRGSPDDSP